MMSSQPGDIGAGSRRSGGLSGLSGTQEHIPRAGKFEKRPQSKKRFRNSFNKDAGSTDASAGQSNARNNTSSTVQGRSTSDFSTIPSWFKTYMEEFKHQIVSEITQKVNKHFDISRDDEAARRRHKTSYFLLKKRYAELEEQLNGKFADENGDNRESTTLVDRYKRTTRGDESKNNQDDDDDKHGHRRRGNYNGLSSKANDECKKDDDRKTRRYDEVPTRVVDSPVCESSTSNDSCDSVVQVVHDDDDDDDDDSGTTAGSQETIKVDVHVDAESTQTIIDDANEGTDDGTNKNAEINTKSTDAIENKSNFTEKLDDILKNPVLHETYTKNVIEKIELLIGDMTDDNTKQLFEKLFEKIQDAPRLADFYSTLISRIVNERPNYIKIQKIFTGVCDEQLDNSNYEKILLICGLYEKRLLSHEFMSKCIKKFMKFDNENNNECFMELLEAVGENSSFWKNSELFVMMENILAKEEVQDEGVIRQINRIVHTVNTSMTE